MTLATLARHHPRWVEAGIRLDRAPAAFWLVLQAAALFPTWRWMAARWRDGADDPLGLLALAALALLLWQQRRALRCTPRLGWLALGGLLTLASTLWREGAGPLPPLLTGLLAVSAVECTTLAFLPRQLPALPVLGLAALALPLLSSLQFYAGYPLRVLTAEASRWLLAPWFTAAREGSSLWLDGRLVIVDAPCSGVQMVWLGYFTACTAALFLVPHGVSTPGGSASRRFMTRLPAVSALVLTGNVVRNALLVAFEGAGHAVPAWAHEGIGLVVLAAVCAGVVGVMTRGAPPVRSPRAEGPGHAPVVLPMQRIHSTAGDHHAHAVR